MLQKNPSVVPREEEAGKFLVFNQDNCTPMVMNNTSYAIWQLCDGTRDPKTITKDLEKQYDCAAANLSHEEVERIVSEHLGLLLYARLLVDVEAGVPAQATS